MSHRPGRREREARKRHRRVRVVANVYAGHNYWLHYPPEADAVPLKLGREHYRRHLMKSIGVAD